MYGSESGSPYGRRGVGVDSRATGREIISPSRGAQNAAADGGAYGSPYQQQQQQHPSGDSPHRNAGGEEKQSLGSSGEFVDDGFDEEEHRAVMAAIANGKCVCQICTCGHHQWSAMTTRVDEAICSFACHCSATCTLSHTRTLSPSLLLSSLLLSSPLSLCLRFSPALVHLQASYDPNLSSAYRASFVPHATSVIRARAPPSTVFSSGERFEGASVTKSDYAPHLGAKPAPLWRPPPGDVVGGPESREFVSEAAANYRSHGWAKRSAAIPAHTMHVTHEPFVGESTTRADFQRFNAKPATPQKPSTSAAPTGPDERDFQTTAAAAYNPKGYVARQPAVPFTTHVFDSDGPFAGESSMKSDFRAWDARPAQSFKPKYNPADLQPDDRQVSSHAQPCSILGQQCSSEGSKMKQERMKQRRRKE